MCGSRSFEVVVSSSGPLREAWDVAQRHAGEARGSFGRVDAWRRGLTDPTSLVVDAEDRRRAATLGSVALALCVLLVLAGVVSAFTSAVFPDPDVSLGYGATAIIVAAGLAFWV